MLLESHTHIILTVRIDLWWIGGPRTPATLHSRPRLNAALQLTQTSVESQQQEFGAFSEDFPSLT
jgi:hypothetical protein